MSERHTPQTPERAYAPRVLVVDDDPALRQMIAELMSYEGFQVVEVESAVGLTDLVRETQPDVVLLDHRMQPVSGLDALQALRASGEQVPVVMLTGVPPDELLESAVDTGADDYVVKPFSDSVLVAHVRAILRRVEWQGGRDVGQTLGVW